MSTSLIDLRPAAAAGIPTSVAVSDADRKTAQIAGVTAIAGVVLSVAGAITQTTSGADLYAAMETSSKAAALDHLSDVAGAQGQLMAGLGIWMLAFPCFAIGGYLLADLGAERTSAKVSKMAFTASLAAMVVFIALIMSFVVGVAPAHAAGEDVWALARTVGFGASTIDWIISALAMGFGPVAAIWAGRGTWAPKWLQNLALVTLAVTLVELFALTIDNRGLAFIVVPVGLVNLAAAGIAALRFAR